MTEVMMTQLVKYKGPTTSWPDTM